LYDSDDGDDDNDGDDNDGVDDDYGGDDNDDDDNDGDIPIIMVMMMRTGRVVMIAPDVGLRFVP
jgi:hypothetical protein